MTSKNISFNFDNNSPKNYISKKIYSENNIAAWICIIDNWNKCSGAERDRCHYRANLSNNINY